MSWILIATICVATSPGRAECKIEISRIEHDRKACAEMIVPTETLMVETAEAAGVDVLYIDAACEFAAAA